jgi:ABC-type phosphate transport system permease subunit
MYHTDFLSCERVQPRTHYTRLDASCKIHEWLFVCHLITCIQTMIGIFVQIYFTKYDEDDHISAVITL